MSLQLELLIIISKKIWISLKLRLLSSKDNHKKIIIGKKGNMIKELGIKSREKIEGFLNKKVSLLYMFWLRLTGRITQIYSKTLDILIK